MKKLITCFIFLILGLWIHSQAQVMGRLDSLASTEVSECAKLLIQAEQNYLDGLFSRIPDLDPCIRNGFSKAERVRALRLLTIVHLYEDQVDDARRTFLALLRVDPEFVPDTTIDPAELSFLYQTFDTEPKGRIELRVGGNFARPLLVRSFSVDQNAREQHSAELDVQVGLAWEQPLGHRENVYVRAELLYQQRRHQYIKNFQTGQLGHPSGEELEDRFDFAVLNYTEVQRWLSFPLGIVYNLPGRQMLKQRSLVPYLFVGAAPSVLVDARFRNLSRRTDDVDLPEDRLNIDSYNLQRFDFTQDGITQRGFLRTRLNLAFMAGVGLQLKLGLNYVTMDLRGTTFLRNHSMATFRASDPTLVYDFGYLSNDFWMGDAALSIGIKHIFYHPRPLDPISKKR